MPAGAELLLLDWLRGCGRRGWRRAGPGGRGEDESVADESETLLWEFGLKKLVVGAGKKVGGTVRDVGHKVVDDDGLAIEGSLLVGVSDKLYRFDGARQLGNDGPESGIVAGDGEGEQGLKRAGVEVWQEDGAGMRIEASRGAMSVGRCIDQDLSCRGEGFRRTDDVDGLAVYDGAQLDVAQVVGGRKQLGFGQRVIETRHGNAHQGRRIVAMRRCGEIEGGGAHRVAVLRDDEAAGLGPGRGWIQGEQRSEAEESKVTQGICASFLLG